MGLKGFIIICVVSEVSILVSLVIFLLNLRKDDVLVGFEIENIIRYLSDINEFYYLV